MKEEHELKPRPFCGSTDIVVVQRHGFSHLSYVMCRECCATTRSSIHTAKAVANWNRRTDVGGGEKDEDA